MIVKQVGIVGAEASALLGVDHASDPYAIKHLTCFAKGSSENMPYYCDEGWCWHKVLYWLDVMGRARSNGKHVEAGQVGRSGE
jgi:hypothetical protein